MRTLSSVRAAAGSLLPVPSVPRKAWRWKRVLGGAGGSGGGGPREGLPQKHPLRRGKTHQFSKWEKQCPGRGEDLSV